MATKDGFFSQGSADDRLANTLQNGDVLLINKCCTSLGPLRGLLCLASKYGLSGDGRGSWDHAAMVVRDRATSVPYLLEGTASGVTMRTYEERLLQSSDHQELVLLPLRVQTGRLLQTPPSAAAVLSGILWRSWGCARRPMASTRQAHRARIHGPSTSS